MADVPRTRGPPGRWTDAGGTGRTCVRVIEAIASAKGIEATELPPLSDVIEPGALGRFVAGPAGGTRDGTVEVRFEYVDHVVTARSNGHVRRRRPTDGRDAANAGGFCGGARAGPQRDEASARWTSWSLDAIGAL